jgi:DNA-binding IclR family transcriptional regulator
MAEQAPSKRRGIQSVVIGLRVLSALGAQHGPANLSTIAQAAGLSASQTHRYLASLIASGMVKQAARSGLYDLDAGAIRIGLAALARLDIFAAADTVFSALARETRRTCLVAVWGDAGPTVVRWFAGSPPLLTSIAIGSVLPLLQSSTGRIFYVLGDRTEMDAKAAALVAADPGLASLDLAALAVQVRADLSASVYGSLIPGLHATAAPVFDLQGRLCLVATVISSTGGSPEDNAAAAVALRAACRSLTESMGGTWPRADAAPQ